MKPFTFNYLIYTPAKIYHAKFGLCDTQEFIITFLFLSTNIECKNEIGRGHKNARVVFSRKYSYPITPSCYIKYDAPNRIKGSRYKYSYFNEKAETLKIQKCLYSLTN